eukprot:jgi/Tetstr1/455877/TSEL_042666.t1
MLLSGRMADSFPATSITSTQNQYCVPGLRPPFTRLAASLVDPTVNCEVGLSAIDEFIESEFFKSGAWKKKPSPPAGEPEPEPPRKRKPRAPPRATKPKRQEEPSEPAPRYEERADFYDSVIIV